MPAIRWKVRTRRGGYTWQGPLVAISEVSGDPISDDYTPDEIDAQELLRHWAARAQEHFPDGLVPISWFVACSSQGKFEAMPFQFLWEYPKEDFLTFYDWPVHPDTGERLNWLSLPVQDKRWNRRRANKGGFIQEATGWKPSILQPLVFLPPLTRAVGASGA
jgi:hypothetical protein